MVISWTENYWLVAYPAASWTDIFLDISLEDRIWMIIVALWPQIASDWSDLSGSNFTECSWLSMPPSCCFLHALFYHHLVMYLQWRNQDITDARAQHGYTIFVRNSEVQKHLEGCGACMLPQNIFGVLSPPTLLLRPHSSAVYVTIRQTRVWWAYTWLVIL